MHRIIVSAGILFLATAAGLHWPCPEPTSAANMPHAQPRNVATVDHRGGCLEVHRPIPHPGLVASGQLLISLYVLVAQQRPLQNNQSA